MFCICVPTRAVERSALSVWSSSAMWKPQSKLWRMKKARSGESDVARLSGTISHDGQRLAISPARAIRARESVGACASRGCQQRRTANQSEGDRCVGFTTIRAGASSGELAGDSIQKGKLRSGFGDSGNLGLGLVSLERHPNHQLENSGVPKGSGTRLRQAAETSNLGATGAAATLSW